MPKTVPNPPPGFDELSVTEQIEYVQSLWDRVAATPEQVPVPEWHRRIIEERLRAYRSHPTTGKPWKQVRQDVERKLADSSSR